MHRVRKAPRPLREGRPRSHEVRSVRAAQGEVLAQHGRANVPSPVHEGRTAGEAHRAGHLLHISPQEHPQLGVHSFATTHSSPSPRPSATLDSPGDGRHNSRPQGTTGARGREANTLDDAAARGRERKRRRGRRSPRASPASPNVIPAPLRAAAPVSPPSPSAHLPLAAPRNARRALQPVLSSSIYPRSLDPSRHTASGARIHRATRLCDDQPHLIVVAILPPRAHPRLPDPAAPFTTADLPVAPDNRDLAIPPTSQPAG